MTAATIQATRSWAVPFLLAVISALLSVLVVQADGMRDELSMIRHEIRQDLKEIDARVRSNSTCCAVNAATLRGP